ncbi:hypothetical protein [Streptomyces sp. 7-21]|jgi:hypothetical protein|uniref:hypothetical protein n=1 Tax=Streptomyces sp. 7-21 TaxID=2802283 RepID=UPI00191E6239|nr:hypothetical protein [Streptomyces sp. 7-21]MBL1067335.1 hypothetical protein [Streptomyces sp. 7-21]
MSIQSVVRGTAAAAAVAVGALVMAPPAPAAAPATASAGAPSESATATVEVYCGYFYGSGEATLAAERHGDEVTLTLTTPVLWATHAIPAGMVRTTVTLSSPDGEEVTFTGRANPDWTVLGQPFDSGPMTGTPPAGEELRFASLVSTAGTMRLECTPLSPQEPPFVF